MNILALDLGTNCGWALSDGASGVWKLKPSAQESIGQRYAKFRTLLSDLTLLKLDLVVYEEVHAHAGVDAAHVFGGLQAVLQVVCLDNKIEYKGVGVGTIKKHATGNGHAKKDAMIMSASLKFKGVNVIDDNHADALWLLDYATKKLFIPQTPAN